MDTYAVLTTILFGGCNNNLYYKMRKLRHRKVITCTQFMEAAHTLNAADWLQPLPCELPDKIRQPGRAQVQPVVSSEDSCMAHLQADKQSATVSLSKTAPVRHPSDLYLSQPKATSTCPCPLTPELNKRKEESWSSQSSEPISELQACLLMLIFPPKEETLVYQWRRPRQALISRQSSCLRSWVLRLQAWALSRCLLLNVNLSCLRRG